MEHFNKSRQDKAALFSVRITSSCMSVSFRSGNQRQARPRGSMIKQSKSSKRAEEDQHLVPRSKDHCLILSLLRCLNVRRLNVALQLRQRE